MSLSLTAARIHPSHSSVELRRCGGDIQEVGYNPTMELIQYLERRKEKPFMRSEFFYFVEVLHDYPMASTKL